jgi:hypothetical protein
LDPARSRAEFSLTLDGRDILRHPLDIEFGTGLRNRCTIRVATFTPDRPRRVVFQLAIPNHETAEWSFMAELRAANPAGGVRPAKLAWTSEPVSIVIMPPSDKKH